MKTKENKNHKAILLATIIFLSGFLVFSSKAETINNIDASSDETQEKIEELEKKAQKYRELIDIKQKQQQSLNNQISIMDASISSFETEIKMVKTKIEDLSEEIFRKEAEIKSNEENLLLQKKILSDLLKTAYEEQNYDIVSALFVKDETAPLFFRMDHVSKTSNKIAEVSEVLKFLREQLETEKGALEKSRSELASSQVVLQEKSANLESSKDSKENLLRQTQGEEQKYQALLAKVEAQKLELLSIDELYATSGLSVDSFPKPDSKYHAPLSWFFSQRDPRWGNVKIGNSRSLLKDYGCAVSSVAMVWTYLGSSITPKELAEKDQYFQWDLIAWPKVWKSIEISTNGSSHGNLSWTTIDAEIKKGNPVIVYIGKSGGKGGHYVVIHHKDKAGKYVVHDPYFGANIFLDTSRALVGAMGTKTATYMDQMIIYRK